MTNPLVAVPNSTSGNAGVGPADNAASITADIGSNSWVDPALGGLGAGLDLLSVALDPLGPLLGWAAAQGAGWLIEWVSPLNEALDALTGNPDAISAHSQTWTNLAQATSQTSQHYTDAVNADTAHWLGATADAYSAHANDHTAVLAGIGHAAVGIAVAAAGAGALVAGVRGIVADLLAQCANTIAGWLPAALVAEGVTAGTATPAIMAQVATLVTTYVDKIKHVIQALLNSMRQLGTMLHRLGDQLSDLTQLSNRLARTHPHLAADGPTPGPLTLHMAKDEVTKWAESNPPPIPIDRRYLPPLSSETDKRAAEEAFSDDPGRGLFGDPRNEEFPDGYVDSHPN